MLVEFEDVKGIVEKEGVKFIHLVFMDILGFQKTVVIPSKRLERAINDGVVFDGSSIVGYATVDESDMRLFPDLSTFKVLPWYDEEHKTAQVICNIYSDGGERFCGDPRYVLEKMMKKAEEMGYIFHTGPEYEYFLFREDGVETGNIKLDDMAGYFDLLPMDRGAIVSKEVTESLTKMGIEVETGHHEVAPSQHEIDLKYSDAMTSADRVALLKYAIKTIAKKHGLHATFMPKPLNGVNGSGMHVHQSLITPGGKNAFYDPDSENGISKVAFHFLAGLLLHAREICAVLASWPNSYKRLIPGFEAPVYVSWAYKNRSALIRVPSGRGMSTRLELRCPDSAGNPYLQFAVMLASGLDGIKRGLEPPPPVEKDIFKMTEKEREEMGIESLPQNLGHALSIMEESELVRDTLGEHVFNHFIHNKRAEWDLYRTQVSEWEVRRYINLL